MNKLTKGAIATAAGVILLMGGAGTLAAWNSNAVAGSSQTITAGQLNVTAGAAGVWKSGSTTINPASFKAVPGDTLTYTQTFTLNASGDNLLFTLTSTPGAITAASAGSADTALAGVLTKSAVFSIAGGTGTIASSTTPGTYKVTAAGSNTITVTMTVAFPYGSVGDNTTQNGAVTFGNGAVTVAQTQTP